MTIKDWLLIVLPVAGLVAGILAAKITGRSWLRRKAIQRAKANAGVYNEVRLIMVKMLAGEILDAAGMLPGIRDELEPEQEEPAALALFMRMVNDWKPPTITIWSIDEEDEDEDE